MTPLFVGLGVALVVTGVVIPILSGAGVWDVANARSSHTGAVPRGGGVGVIAGLLAGVLATSSELSRVGWAVLAWMLLMAGIGLLDDLRGMPVVSRLVAQFVLAGAMAAYLAQTSRDGWVTLILGLLGALWLVSYVNAFNFMDGINGISALSGAVAGGWYAWVGHSVDSTVLLVFGLALLGGCLGFLPWNSPRARVFLGDVGSYGIGAVIAALALVAWLYHVGLIYSLAPLVVYLADTAFVLLQRARRGESLGEAHRDHVYQRLVDGGWSHLVTGFVVAAAAAVVCVGVATLGSTPAVALGVLVLLAYLSLPALVGQHQKAS